MRTVLLGSPTHCLAHSQPCALFLHPHIQNFRGLGSGVLCVQRHKYSAVCTLLTHMQNHSQHHTVALFNGKCNGCAKATHTCAEAKVACALQCAHVDVQKQPAAKATLALKQRWSNTAPCTSHPSMHNWPTGWVTPTSNVYIALPEQFQFKPLTPTRFSVSQLFGLMW